MSTEDRLLQLIYAREKHLLKNTPEAAAQAARLDALLQKGVAAWKNRCPLSKKAAGRLTLVLTRACQLRCPYCTMSKEGGNMSPELIKRGVELLLAGRLRDLQLHFFGGEPLLRFDSLQQAVSLAESLKEKAGKTVRYFVTTNGLALEKRMLEFFKRFDFTIEFSFDGLEDTFAAQRPGLRGDNFYAKIRPNLDMLRDSGVPYHVTMVVSPESAAALEKNVDHLAAMGHRRIQINYQNNRAWPDEALRALLGAMGRVSRKAALDQSFQLMNANGYRREPVLLNSDLLLDVDGNLYPNIGILLEEGFGLVQSDLLISGSEPLHDLDALAPSLFDTFLMLAAAYERRNPDLRRLVMNIIRVGYAVDRCLNPGAKAPIQTQGRPNALALA